MVILILYFSILLIYFSSSFENIEIIKWFGLLIYIPISSLVIWSAAKGNSQSIAIHLSILVFGLIIFSGSRESSDLNKSGVDFSYLGRLFLLGGNLIIGFIHFPLILKVTSGRPLKWIWIISLLSILSCVVSPHFLYSLSLAMSLFACVIFSIVVGIRLSPKEIFNTLNMTLLFIILLSWLVYLTFPDIGSYYTSIWDGSKVWRFKGITSHPNTMGMIAGLYVGIILNSIGKIYIWRPVGILLFFIGGLTLIETNSRTAMVATFLSSIFMLVVKNPRVLKLVIPSTIFIALMFFAISFNSTEYLNQWSRSGDLNEIQSFTGRMGLWLSAINIISNSVWIGYGFMSTAWVFERFAPNIWDAMHSHNMLIESMMFFGLSGTIVLIFLYVDSMIYVFKYKNVALAYLTGFTFISGLTETSLMSRSFILMIFFTIIIAMNIGLKKSHNLV